jgi:hypothetical protein
MRWKKSFSREGRSFIRKEVQKIDRRFSKMALTLRFNWKDGEDTHPRKFENEYGKPQIAMVATTGTWSEGCFHPRAFL